MAVPVSVQEGLHCAVGHGLRCTQLACLRACMYRCAHTCTHAHTHARTHACTHARTHARTHAPTHARTHPRTHARTHASAHARTHARMHALMHAHTHTCTDTRASTLSWHASSVSRRAADTTSPCCAHARRIAALIILGGCAWGLTYGLAPLWYYIQAEVIQPFKGAPAAGDGVRTPLPPLPRPLSRPLSRMSAHKVWMR